MLLHVVHNDAVVSRKATSVVLVVDVRIIEGTYTLVLKYWINIIFHPEWCSFARLTVQLTDGRAALQ